MQTGHRNSDWRLYPGANYGVIGMVHDGKTVECLPWVVAADSGSPQQWARGKNIGRQVGGSDAWCEANGMQG